MGNEPEKVINGVARPEGDVDNCWEAELSKNGATITFDFGKTVNLSMLQLTFDSNLTKEIMPSMTRNVRDRQVKGMPHELVKDYQIKLYKDGNEVLDKTISDNYLRLNRVLFDEGIECDTVSVTVLNTHGIDRARIYEVRAY